MSISVESRPVERADAPAGSEPGPRGAFADALARAAEDEGQGPPPPKGPAPGGAHHPRPARRAPGARRPPAGAGADPPGGPPAPPVPPRPGPVEAPGVTELRAYVRAAPAVIAAAFRPDGAHLALSFGSALSLDLRSGAQGLELTLRPAQRLERVARGELPALVEALRARGIRVVRAQVCPRTPATPRRAR